MSWIIIFVLLTGLKLVWCGESDSLVNSALFEETAKLTSSLRDVGSLYLDGDGSNDGSSEDHLTPGDFNHLSERKQHTKGPPSTIIHEQNPGVIYSVSTKSSPSTTAYPRGTDRLEQDCTLAGDKQHHQPSFQLDVPKLFVDNVEPEQLAEQKSFDKKAFNGQRLTIGGDWVSTNYLPLTGSMALNENSALIQLEVNDEGENILIMLEAKEDKVSGNCLRLVNVAHKENPTILTIKPPRSSKQDGPNQRLVFLKPNQKYDLRVKVEIEAEEISFGTIWVKAKLIRFLPLALNNSKLFLMDLPIYSEDVQLFLRKLTEIALKPLHIYKPSSTSSILSLREDLTRLIQRDSLLSTQIDQNGTIFFDKVRRKDAEDMSEAGCCALDMKSGLETYVINGTGLMLLELDQDVPQKNGTSATKNRLKRKRKCCRCTIL